MRYYSTYEDNIIKVMYADHTLSEIAKKINRIPSSVHVRAKKLGLSLTPEQKAKHFEIGLKNGAEKGRFHKGQIPWNKGMKGIHFSPQSEFKKGHIPHNTKYDGCISIRRDVNGLYYKYIRISKANWVLLHRHIWEEKQGKIPEGMILIFKDGNQMNCELSNLKLITMQENIERNSIHRYPEDLRAVIMTRAALTRKINNLNK